MHENADLWPEGQQAWRRLAWWRENTPDGDDALTALSDLGLVRRLLDQTEFDAVRTARSAGKPWSEIAVRLGVTRQSAWERWRDLDEAPQPERDLAVQIRERAGAEVAGRRRRQGTVKVPNVIGRSFDDARALLAKNDLMAASPDPDEPALPESDWHEAVVVDQSPESGAKVPPGSAVTLWLRRGGGGSGVREPRRPKPDPKTGRKMRDEVTGETVT
ncbi:PASTA domain-containing protein [Amycolatopsis alkalitolerans]|uniref:PASTA domain-containing protein n=1 Tax=Amycolatopsis alkalitolerans TaxID=2547244 RepID=A0A5C4M2W5_9PSEU|nr:PASTA domain-containing protein [Amycolatopsis alkalitolerans]TNC24192.1 PASTA domain-containing protein [Amycolatopsis alkalitolerans]